jgi:hypothetical protein
MFGDSLFEDTISIIKNWTSEKEYSNETSYRDDLLDVLREKLNEVNNPLFGRQNRVSLAKEDGRGLCDIGINRQIGIELKKDLKSKSQVDRLVGQIHGYKKDYQDLIIVLVGKTNKEALEGLKDRISDLTTNTSYGLNQEPRIKIIDKSLKTNDSAKKKNNKRNKSSTFPEIRPFGIDLNNIKPFGIDL